MLVLIFLCLTSLLSASSLSGDGSISERQQITQGDHKASHLPIQESALAARLDSVVPGVRIVPSAYSLLVRQEAPFIISTPTAEFSAPPLYRLLCTLRL